MDAIRLSGATLLTSLVLTISGCGGSSSDGDPSDSGAGNDGAIAYTVGGQVNGLSGDQLIIRLNDDELLAIDDDGSFSFTSELEEGNSFSVDNAVLPEGPAQNCDIFNGSGTVGDSDITDIEIDCHLALAITGRTAGPVVPAAIISAVVGDDEYETQTDEQGMYSLRISIRDSEDMVYLEARDPTDAFVVYQGYPGSIGRLKELATEAGILTREQSVSVNLSNVSTASAALMRWLNEGSAPASDLERSELRQDIPPSLRLTSAALIEIAILDENRTLSPLSLAGTSSQAPGDADSTASLIENEESRESYEAEVRENDPDAIDNSIAGIMDNSDLTEEVDENDLPESWFANLSFEPNIITGDLIEFSDNGRGIFLNSTSETGFDWTLEGNLIDITTDDPIVTVAFCFVEVDDEEFQTACVSEYDDVDINVVETGSPADVLSIRFAGMRHYPDIDKDSEAVDFRNEVLAYDPSDVQAFPADLVEGETWSLPGAFSGLAGALPSHGEELLTFHTGGVGEASESGAFNWSIDDHGLLHIEFGSNISHQIGVIRTYNAPLQFISVESVNEDGNRRSSRRTMARAADSGGLDEAFASHLFMQWGTEANRFAIDLREDGWGGPIDMNADFSGTDGGPFYLFDYRFDGGRLLMESWAQPQDGSDDVWWGRESICDDTAEEDCYLVFVRSWDQLSDDGVTATIREHIVHYEADGSPISISPRTIQYSRFQD